MRESLSGLFFIFSVLLFFSFYQTCQEIRKNKAERKEGFAHTELQKKCHLAADEEGFLRKKRFIALFL